MRGANRATEHADRGFGMIELVVALILLTAVTVTFYRAFWTTHWAAGRLSERDRLLSRAEMIMDMAKLDPAQANRLTQDTGPGGVSWTVTRTPYIEAGPRNEIREPARAALIEITVAAEIDGQPTIELTALQFQPEGVP